MANLILLLDRVRIQYLLVLSMLLTCHWVKGQDIHFSQFMSSPMNLNPAHTGNFDGAIRIVGNGRQQWRSVTLPYQTFGMSVDMKNLPRLKHTAGGLAAYNDRTGDSKLNTFVTNASIAQTFPFDKKATQGITLGFTVGITQRSIDYSKLNFNNQYNGIAYNPDAANNETFGKSSFMQPNIHVGIAWFKHQNLRNKINTGISLLHITTPNQSFFSDQPSLLDRRLNVHANVQHTLSKRVDVLPAALFSMQGAYVSFSVGGAVKYILNANPTYYRAVYLGAWTRAGDAAWLSAGMDYGNLYACISYDLNYSSLQPATNTRGGVEVSVIYIIKHLVPKRKRYLACPDFL